MGTQQKVLKGLDFQILYKKISDSIGLYKAEITLPDAMRYIRMGQYNITLPVFGVEYYTNGDFLIDVGFPWKANFARSLTFQTLIWTPIGIPIPVMGSIGVYFGKLSSATTDKVPKITNGTFNPVIVFGFGIQFGIGYTFDVGILKAGFSLTAVAILEGVFAKFNLYDNQLPDKAKQANQIESSYYFMLKGTVGIIGKLFGSIDFKIIKADVNIDIRILASFTFAPYEPILLDLTASVVIEVSVKINLGLFKITISFSFAAKISQSVTIHAIGGEPPWQLADSSTPDLFIAARRKRRRSLGDHLMLMAQAAHIAPNWENLKATSSKDSLQGYMTLGLTMAGDGAKEPTDQVACYVAMLLIDSMPPPQQKRTDGIAKAFAAAADSSFERLAKMVLRWAVSALEAQPKTAEEIDGVLITDLKLEALLKTLNNPDNPTPISADAIEKFMAGQFDFNVEGPTTSKEAHATYFPVAPSMTLSLPKYGDGYDPLSYSFGDYNGTSADYLTFLRHYFDELAVKVEKENDELMTEFALDDNSSESLGSFIFNDYFLMLCRQMIQTALDSLREFKYFPEAGQSVTKIVEQINKISGHSAAAFTVEELFTDNAEHPLNKGKVISIEKATYIVQANDTFDKIATNALFGGGFDGAKLAKLNGGANDTLTAGIEIEYPGKAAYITQPGQSLATVAKEIGVSLDDLIAKGGVTSLANLPQPVATYQLPPFTYQTAESDSLRTIAGKFRIDQAALAAPTTNGTIIDLFNVKDDSYLDIANLNQCLVGELLKEIQATQGLQHLSGMTSRYYMAGLRLPTDGITPLKKGMWVSGDKPAGYKLPDFAGLYALTGQQFPIPTLNDTDNFDIGFGTGGRPWLNFVNSDPSKLTISVKPKTDDAAQINLVKDYATKNYLDTGLSTLGLYGMFNTKEATYTFNSQIDWNAASAFVMPYGGMPPGIPDMQLWRMPDSLLALPDPETRKVNPRMAMKIGEYNEAYRGMVKRDLDYYGFGSLIEFTVKRVPETAASPSTKTTYEVMGADGSSANVLERIVREIGGNNEGIQTLILAYSANPNSTTSNGIQTENPKAITMGLAQVNLSTVTRPDASFAHAMLLAEDDTKEMTLLNEKSDFVRLLWEASITRAGGYFLYYFNSDSGGGLPDRIFNDDNEALLSMIVLYAQPNPNLQKGTIGSYMNVLLTGEAIDQKKATLFGEADPVQQTLSTNSLQTLADLAYAYFGNVSEVAADNSKLTLRNGLSITISEGLYEVGVDAPGGVVSDIATHFGVSVEKLKETNPKITNWPDQGNALPLYTALYLPRMTVSIGSEAIGITLEGIAIAYGMNLTALANANRDAVGIFADGQSITISGGPVVTAATVPAGNVSVGAARPKPEEIPEKPAGSDYGKTFLRNMYSMLSYQITDNPYFNPSKLGLPAGPMTETENPENLSKLQVPKVIQAGDDWIYRQAVPYTQFSKQTPTALTDLPDQDKSPYKGLGDLLQVEFAWQDLYGNRLKTDLSEPKAKGSVPLNRPPIKTGYSDALIGLTQWPSVASNYEINFAKGKKPQIELDLTFDASVYKGLIYGKITGKQTIEAIFTDSLDKASAETLDNYTFDQGVKLKSAVLGDNTRTVSLTTENALPTDEDITLTVVNINDESKGLTFQGVAQFHADQPLAKTTSTLLRKARGDLQTYTQLWYQLTDPYGIGYQVATSLVTEPFKLDDTQTSTLVESWVASIWRYVNDRAQGAITVTAPASIHPITFLIDEAKLNQSEIFELDLSFTIERIGGANMGDLETTGGIAKVSTPISPYAGTAGKEASSLNDFADNFNKVLSKPGTYQLEIASGVNRKENLSSTGGNELWVIRLGENDKTSISYEINNPADPLIFAPRPISTKLENRNKVPIWDFNGQSGIDFNKEPSRHLDFTGIDMDLWGKQFFGKLDAILSPEFTAAIQLVDHNKTTEFLQTMLDNKTALANIVQEWMSFVFDGESGSTSEIREAFRQQLLVQLSHAYSVKAGVQYDAKVEAGEFKLLFASTDSTHPNQVTLLFTSDIDQKTAADIKNYSLSGGLKVTSAEINLENGQKVTLQLNRQPIASETTVTIADTFTDKRGSKITGLKQIVIQAGEAATPELYGNFVQNFRFVGVALDEKEKKRLYLYFSKAVDQTEAEKPATYTVSGLSINSAKVDKESDDIVVLELSGDAIVDKTTVTVADSLTDAAGLKLIDNLCHTVAKNVDISHITSNVSMTAAKVNLKNGENVPLPFLLSAPQIVRGNSGAILPYIELNNTFNASSIEHQIGSLPDVADYRASTWLNFLDDPAVLDQGNLSAKVPMVLRTFPTSPSMVAQEGGATNPLKGSNFSNILAWNYTIRYSQTTHYPQDELDFTVNFNVHDGDLALAAITDAFGQLAQFITIYPEVEKVFRSTLIQIDAKTTDQSMFDSAAVGLKAFNEMVGRIIQAAEGNGLKMADFSLPRLSNTVDPYKFRLQEGVATVQNEDAALLVIITGKPPAGINDPIVQIPGYTTKKFTGSCHGDYCFTFEDQNGKLLPAAVGQNIGPRNVVLPNMNILARQDAETTVELHRNVDLVPGKATSPDFIYTTGEVRFADIYHPFIEYDQSLPISSNNATLEQHLIDLFASLLKDNSQETLSFLMTCTYSYKFNSLLEPITVPIIMQPLQAFDVKPGPSHIDIANKSLAEMITSWSNSITQWCQEHEVDTTDATFNFDLTIFSNLTQQPLPLIRLKALQLDEKYVSAS